MKNKSLLTVLACIIFLIGCSDDPDPNNSGGNNIDNYVLVTFNGTINPNPQVANMSISYISDITKTPIDYTQYPTQEYSNTMGLCNVYNNKWLFIRANKKGDRGIQKYVINDKGLLQDAGFIETPFPSPLSPVKFCIANDQNGYFVNQDKRYSIQMFNPKTMTLKNEIIDLEKEVKAFKLNIDAEFSGKLGKEAPYSLIGQETIITANGKLYVNVHYGQTKNKGVLDALYKEFYLAVIDLKTNKFEKIISLPGIYNQGLPPLENQHLAASTEGSIYFITHQWNNYDPNKGIILQAMDEGQIFRLTKDGDFDPSWRLRTSDFGRPSGGKYVFESICEYDNDLYVTVSKSEYKAYGLTQASTPDFDVYKINPQTKEKTKIEIPVTVPNVASGSFYKIDNQLYIRIVNESEGHNGFYKLNADKRTTTKVFDIVPNKGIALSLLKLKKD